MAFQLQRMTLVASEHSGNAWFRSALRKRFISFEGPEGAGKSTQIKLLASKLEAFGLDVVLTREPGGTKTGEQIREILLSFRQDALDPATEALLMTAARAKHVDEVIVPALARGTWVLTDRYVDSTYAYQGYGRGLDIELLREIQQLATSGILPSTTLLLDLPVVEGLSRRLSSSEAFNRLDLESQAFHERVRTGYIRLASADPDRWQIVNASQNETAVAASIWEILRSRFGDELDAVPNIVSGTNE